MKVAFNYLLDRQILIPTSQPTLEMQTDDNVRATRCPIYRQAIKSSLYLITTGSISITWHGGREYEIEYPDTWDESYAKARKAWLDTPGVKTSTTTRYVSKKVLGCKAAGCSLHQGSLVLNFFTGMSINTPLNVRTLVTRPTNRMSPNWTVQDGIYQTDAFHGEFSLNLQIMRTGVPIVIRAFDPVASLFFLSHEEADIALYHHESQEALDAAAAASVFYMRKDRGEGYAAQCPVRAD